MSTLDFMHKPILVQNPPAFTVLSTFAGCGGSSLGYVWAGGKVLLAVEWDDNAVETYKLNFPSTPVFHGDIATLSVEECLRLATLQAGELDILDGSPPCQGFSVNGKRILDDPRNQLFRDYVRLLRGLRPKVFVMENVSGMVKGKMKLIFAEIMRELKASGYRVSARLLNAQYYGVPQSRARMIFIGVREDLGIEPSHPKPQTRLIPARAAIDDLSIDLSSVPHVFPGMRWAVRLAKAGEQLSRYHPKGYWYNYSRVHRDKPSQTIAKSNFGKLYHYREDRCLAPEEMRALASFPQEYRFAGDFEDA